MLCAVEPGSVNRINWYWALVTAGGKIADFAGVRPLRVLIPVLLSLLVIACDSASEPQLDSVQPEPVSEVCSGTVNLLKNPGFNAPGPSQMSGWNSTQHGNIPSFAVSVNEGVVTVVRTGPEPWYNLEQFVDLKEFAGHQMLYQAELKLALNKDGWEHAFEPRGGLQVLIWAIGEPAMLGTRLTVDISAEHSPNLGETGWFPARVLFSVPKRPQRSMVGLVHKANGSISIRNPMLLDCGPIQAPEA